MNKTGLLTLTALMLSSVAAAEECAALDENKEIEVLNYIKVRYSFPKEGRLDLVSSTFVQGTCYRRLLISSNSPRRVFSMYLSPDQRFLTPSLLDITIDPELERRTTAAETSRLLSRGHPPSTGTDERPVTIVEFSDFQCPYCKRFSEIFGSLPDSEKQKVRLVFRQFPLAMHKWARTAAELAVCASQQSNDAFWKASEFFFQRQSSLGQGTVFTSFIDFANRDGSISEDAIYRCVAGSAAQPTLDQDASIANMLGVTGTPTLFINGERVAGVKTVEELTSVIDEAIARSTAPKHASPPGR